MPATRNWRNVGVRLNDRTSRTRESERGYLTRASVFLLPQLMGQHFKFVHAEHFHVLFGGGCGADTVHHRAASGESVLVVPQGEGK